MSIPLKKRSVGELLSLTFQLGFQNFAKLFLIALLFQVPNLLVQLGFPTLEREGDKTIASLGAVVVLLLSLILGPLQQASMMQVVADAFTSAKTSLGRCLMIGLKRFLPLLAFSMLNTLLIAIGFVLFFVPGIFFFTVFAVGAPALVVEGLGPIAAFKRSAELTRGFRWQVLAFLIVLVLIIGFISGSFGIISAILSPSSLGTPAFIIVQWAVSVFSSVFFLAGPVVLYFQLRIEKENLDIQSLTALVDQIGRQRQSAGTSPQES
ncbi:MAG TPA: hypothetical protein ENK02_01450 [Planctomycetes bacterium]|nr:hypothetical protein [Planctomycetota bacterium]